ncbi:MAG TPA: xylulokinase [Anaerolineaceae bacterium]|nr:xylulokinase [Anaerolineaceae bacterium]
MKHFILAHDLGTTGDKATLFDEGLNLAASAFSGYDTYCPQPTWAEQNPLDWWRAVVLATRALLAQSSAAPGDIAAIAFSGQMMGCLPVDSRGQPLRSCLIWADQRAVAQTDRLGEAIGEERLYRITGHRNSPTYGAPKIMWLRDNEPETFARTHKFLHAKDYVAYRMTGAFVTDRSDAGGLNLYHLENGEWADEILAAAGLDPQLLPAIHSSTDVIGELTHQAADELGLEVGTPVVIGAGDGVSATAGAGAVAEGLAYSYIGSSAWISFASPRPVYDRGRRIFNWTHMVPGLFSPCGAMQAAGGSYQWLRRQVCWSEDREASETGGDVYEIMNRRAAESVPGANGLLFLPYLQGERSPHWNPRARGGFIGLQITHTRADLIRATLEGISMNLRTILEIFLGAGARIDEMILIGGGAKGALWRQILADVFGRPILRPALLDEATSLGAAVAGGVGVGLLRDFSTARQRMEIVARHTPDPEAQKIYDQIYPIFLASYNALVPIYDQMSKNIP